MSYKESSNYPLYPIFDVFHENRFLDQNNGYNGYKKVTNDYKGR